jgi:hypothetical protein
MHGKSSAQPGLDRLGNDRNPGVLENQARKKPRIAAGLFFDELGSDYSPFSSLAFLGAAFFLGFSSPSAFSALGFLAGRAFRLDCGTGAQVLI